MSTGETVTDLAPSFRGAPSRLLGDRRLARLAAQGDAAAFEAIFRRYHQDLYRYCLAMLRDAEEAQDALQSTMAAALRALPHDGREIALRPWLYRVAHNEAISIMRRRAVLTDPATVPDSSAPGADASAEARERLRGLVADLGTLPDRQRGALVMRELSGLGYAEIAEALGASEAAARQVVYEARVALRELEDGRQMDCEEARRALSARDGRILRGRRLRSHLRGCETCRDFRAAIQRRRSDLEALFPPLPAAAASALVASALTGTGSGGGGAVAGSGAALGAAGTGSGIGGVAMTIGASGGVKAASLAVAVAVGAGAAGATGLVDTPWTPDRSRSEAADARSATPDRGRGTNAAGGTADVSGAASEAGLEQSSAPGAATKPGGGSAAEPRSEDIPPGAADALGVRPGHIGGGDGLPEHPDASGGPPAHASSQGGPPAHAGASEAPAYAGHGGPPAHAGARAGPPPHASAGGGGVGTTPLGDGPSAHASSRAHVSRATGALAARSVSTMTDRRSSVPKDEAAAEEPKNAKGPE